MKEECLVSDADLLKSLETGLSLRPADKTRACLYCLLLFIVLSSSSLTSIFIIERLLMAGGAGILNVSIGVLCSYTYCPLFSSLTSFICSDFSSIPNKVCLKLNNTPNNNKVKTI